MLFNPSMAKMNKRREKGSPSLVELPDTYAGGMEQDAVLLLKDGIDLIPDSEKALSSLLSYPLYETLASTEGKPILEDGVSEIAKSLLAAYDGGELSGALAEGQAGWKNWVKNFGKLLKRKGKSLFMPLRVLLTGKLHGPDIGATTLLLYKAGTSGCVVPQAEFVTFDERFKILREVQWESFSTNVPLSAGAVTH
ncbi:Glutamate--tRNA ligase, chloroplastic/mitochondrial [Capsicum annuum]|nr:Glutamate--tRNA ligase, chloroplastic/mitochondrial [Capsicum annuum]